MPVRGELWAVGARPMKMSQLKSIASSNAPNGSDSEVLRKGPWMPEEDEILVEYVRQFGARDWSSIRTKGLLPRTGKSCRLRWVNKLKPDLKRSGCKFSPEEEKLVVEMQAKLGNKWAKIASCLPGRTDNDVKNFWSTRQKRILRALQRPKLPGQPAAGPGAAPSATSTDASADTSDLSNPGCKLHRLGHHLQGAGPAAASSSSLNHDPFGGAGSFQVHSPSGGASLMGNGMAPHFISFADQGDSEFRDHSGTDASQLRCHHHMRSHHSAHVHNMTSFAAQLDSHADDHMLSSHKLQGDPMPAGDQCGAYSTDDAKPSTTSTFLHHPHLSVALPTSRTTPTTSRSIKRRPRSRRDTRSLTTTTTTTTLSSSFDQPINTDITTSTIINNNNNNNNNNYLEFLLQSEAGSLQMFSPSEFPLFLSGSPHELPMLYNAEDMDEGGLCCSGSKDAADSCSPDSVIPNFTADVFDSLEPLSSAPGAEWWVPQ